MSPDLCALTTDDLRGLAGALRSGRLRPPFSGLALKRYISDRDAEPIARALRAGADGGLSPGQIAGTLELLAADRARRARPDDAIDLVWTGPEADGIANRDTSVVVRDLFSEARCSVLVAGYAVYQGPVIFRALAGRMDQDPGLRVTMFLDVQRPRQDTSDAAEIVRRFGRRFQDREWPGRRLPDLYYDPRSLDADPSRRASLHAKCVVVDGERSLVSSANFTEAAQLRNIEVGVLVRSTHLAGRLTRHFEGLAASGALMRIPPAGIAAGGTQCQ